MKLSVYTILLLTLLLTCGRVAAAESGETDMPALVPPTSPLEAYYDVLSELEHAVDAYFRDALRLRIAVTDARLGELDAALQEQARLASESELPRLLTVRELVVRAKLTMLRDLDEQFAGGYLPADVAQHIESLYAKRQAAIDLLIAGGEL